MYVCKKNRYETKNTNETKETKVDTFSDGIATLDGFGEQDLFATNKAKEAFSTPVSDPFGNAFSAQPSNVSFSSTAFWQSYIHNIYSPAFRFLFYKLILIKKNL